MKTKTKFISFVLMLGAVVTLHFPAFAQETELMLLLDRVSEQLDSYPEYDSWKASVVSTTTKMDKNWQPKKVTIVKKILEIANNEETEEVLQALETEKGKTKDVTEKYIKEAKKQREKAKKKERERKLKRKKENNERKVELAWDDIFPFSEEKRINYNFIKLEDSYIDDLPVYVLESRAKIKNEKLWEGKYYIDKDSFNVLKVDLKPSKNPKFVKELEMEMSFQVIPQGYFVLKKSRMRINGGIFIKRIRITVEEEYSDYEIINSEEAGI
ncbi:MAG: hypothetical protein ACE5WD_11880 [Candidatus Aminicenantia bacterium]